MAYIIDASYFQREYYIPNVDELNSSALDDISLFIDDKVRLCLQNALGYTLWADLDSNITNGKLNVGAPAKWQNLVNGTTYVKDGKTFAWNGLIYQSGAFKSSLLTPYVFYHWLEYNQSKVTGIGEVVVNSKNAINVNSNQRLTSAWNSFVKQYQDGIYEFAYDRYYRMGIKVVDWYGNNTNNQFVSLIQFLNDNETDYPDASLIKYKYKNELGI